MLLSQLPVALSACFAPLLPLLDPRTAPRLALLLAGALFARGRRTVTAWLRAAGITTDFRRAYYALAMAGRRADRIAVGLWTALVRPLLRRWSDQHWLFALDDTPTARYGPCVQGAGRHHNPAPGPAGAKFLYGHVWVTLAALLRHPCWHTLALPLRTLLYVRAKDVPKLAKTQRWTFRTKLELGVELLRWLTVWLGQGPPALWLAVDGGYAKRPFLRPVLQLGWVVFSRLRKDAHLRDLPAPRRPGQRGRQPIYGKNKISLARRASQQRGWQRVECVQYGKHVVKTIKTFLATWEPVGGVIRVVLVREATGWVAFFCTDATVTAEQILETAADRGAIEQTFKEVKEVWGAGQQQVRGVYANVGAFVLNVTLYTLVEVWSWSRGEKELVDRQSSPWDQEERRPSHADKRRAWQRQILAEEIQQVLPRGPKAREFQALAQRLLNIAA